MIRKLRIKFILVSMFSMLLVLSVILGIVNVLNYDEIVHDADSVLALLNAHAGELRRDDPQISVRNVPDAQLRLRHGRHADERAAGHALGCLLHSSHILPWYRGVSVGVHRSSAVRPAGRSGRLPGLLVARLSAVPGPMMAPRAAREESSAWGISRKAPSRKWGRWK